MPGLYLSGKTLKDYSPGNQASPGKIVLRYSCQMEKAMATHSSVLAWRIPGTGAWWAAVYGVAQSRTRLK